MPAEGDSVESDHDRSKVEEPATIVRAIVRASIVERMENLRSAPVGVRLHTVQSGTEELHEPLRSASRSHVTEPP
ncbi:hypothetical protein BRAS3843_520125 [Bradyrhizobium sp. STM 3843]|nr:hypothetical protein BRAS3843_520125 [Bradyrhizobium sp. STM 3843]